MRLVDRIVRSLGYLKNQASEQRHRFDLYELQQACQAAPTKASMPGNTAMQLIVRSLRMILVRLIYHEELEPPHHTKTYLKFENPRYGSSPKRKNEHMLEERFYDFQRLEPDDLSGRLPLDGPSKVALYNEERCVRIYFSNQAHNSVDSNIGGASTSLDEQNTNLEASHTQAS